jgi:hypothetical protein
MIPLQWVRIQQTGYIARCGDVDIGMIACKRDGSYHWKIDGVYMKWIARSYGDVKTLDTAKAAITRGWRKWLSKAGIGQ